MKKRPEIEVIEADNPSKPLGFVVYEVMPGSPEAKKWDKQLDFGRQQATDIADSYRDVHGIIPQDPKSTGFVSLPVLQFLWGKPWDNMATNYLESLRPSMIRVTTGAVTCDACSWRVTVYLEEDGRTIKTIEQEVKVALVGCRYGADLARYAQNLKQPLETLGIINPRGLKNS